LIASPRSSCHFEHPLVLSLPTSVDPVISSRAAALSFRAAKRREIFPCAGQDFSSLALVEMTKAQLSVRREEILLTVRLHRADHGFDEGDQRPFVIHYRPPLSLGDLTMAIPQPLAPSPSGTDS
jgi:hypothetical protein